MREIEEAASLARVCTRQLGVAWVGPRKKMAIDRYPWSLAVSSMLVSIVVVVSTAGRSSPQYEYDMTLPRIALDVELALQLQGVEICVRHS
ncbi:hypothetical protein BDA96_04G057100 [Sorghum bicolor]|jgi:hypothetical protein|uniref:Uncharacterized protein n=2 Tax=Sorghum bicolor TaxID=4558 RepID=A0A921R2A8_SORBI|nr:hypothetical protein BDA96_04G057100 [Sorghum bicolor]KAG0531844.1 hypothetical protein BDA96_04G057100 [Sorghum bicolor]KAG0531845.1 hypothetical protein BDA96_04G057100 [Sorghum bicolor]KXG29542.1 hypothetical protein SORBI_3004G052100 [Sorghum bicolor]